MHEERRNPFFHFPSVEFAETCSGRLDLLKEEAASSLMLDF